MQYDVITIGTATRDVFLKSSALKVVRSKEHLAKLGFQGGAECFALGAKIDIETPVITTGGGATNAAVTFARQGYKTACITSLGDDTIADEIITDLEAEGVTIYASRNKKHGSGYSTLLLTGGGERTILVYRGAANDLSDKELPLKDLKTKWVYITPSGISFSVMMRLIKHFKKSGAKIAMNPSSHYLEFGAKKLKPMLKMLDVVSMNREEAALLTGEDFEDEKAIFKAFDALIEEGIAVMTEGPKGSLVSDGTQIYRAGIFKEKELLDRTGAGDAFGSGFVAGIIQENDIPYAMRLGSANSTSVVEHIGAKKGIITRQGFTKAQRFKDLTINTQ